jgi:glycosidase
MTLALDIWEEDRRLRGLGPGAIPVLEFGRGMFAAGEPEAEAFSRDKDWMSNLVLIAKNVHVWLDQLSRRYERHLRRLDDIPDEELDRLARWGFRGLWLIGLWERSRASQKIKQYTGNPEAVASAYSLLDYRIADDLGGEEAWKTLKERAWRRGIRLASDMVPNHMGIDSRWVIEHPHWFVQLDHPPYPWYTFGGGNLSDDGRAGIYIEDGYWERRDAAVVFKRVDHQTGEARYIYHGNDGTSMPWNDTAQLNFLLPEVREAVIRTILHVARLFPIIRFDAAMTLAKRHYQRLWFPQPGDAGAIPSRAERGMSKADFDRQMPVEFWREVVDRVAAEAPDTLLLAEAFWLMEGYFVRTLGMHRVYNSAFMNMLKMEENQKYRQTVKNVLEFSPEVLKRFVNFMNNPDERTAVEQFGKGDKYFGVCMLMVTMPGLPMFGHGQIEGFTEKYGMEYRRAYWDEPVDEHMVWRHETEIFPLMRRRNLFSGAENFALFDFVRGDGGVDENVFAYSNRAGGERALILYNNAYDRTAGTLHTSTAINTGSVDAPALVRRSLAEALGLDASGACYYRFHDHKTGFEYIRSGREIAERGLFATLDGYQWHAFLDWEELRDTDGRWGELERLLAGRPVPNIHVARLEMEIAAVLAPYEALLRKALLLAARPEEAPLRAEFEEELARFLEAASAFSGGEDRRAEQPRKRGKSFSECAAASLDLLLEPERALARAGAKPATAVAIIERHDWRATPGFLRSQLFSLAMRAAGRAGAPGPVEEREARLLARINEWFLGRKAFETLHDPVGDPRAARQDAMLAVMTAVWAPVLAAEPGSRTGGAGSRLARAFQDPSVAEFLLIHEHAGVHWLNKERLERFVQSLIPAALLTLCEEDRLKSDAIDRVLEAGDRVVRAAAETGYRVAEMLRKLGDA